MPRRRDFEIVVIGAGSAGCALASALASAGRRVALVEAGPDYGARHFRRWPPELLDARSRPETHDWGWSEPAARVIGGCSAHNQCAAIWPPLEDFARWPGRGWDAETVRRLIDRVERAAVPTPDRGRHGRLPTRRYRDTELSSWQRAFLEAARRAGFPRVRDLSAPSPIEAVAPFHANVRDGIRWNAAFAFIDPIYRRTKLDIFGGTLAERLVIEGDRAAGVVCAEGRREVALRADEFVLCAGAFGSPAILMRSGIGPADQLARVGIRVRRELAGVGRNLHDHPGAALEITPTPAASRAALADERRGRDHQSQVILRARSDPRRLWFDLHLVPYYSGGRTFDVLVFLLSPLSRGTVRLRDADPASAPRIALRLFSDPGSRDLDAVARGVRLARRILREEPLASASRRIRPAAWLGSRDELRSYIRANATSYSHPVGTCRMGRSGDPLAVTDAAGRVRGLENVRVADASIFPRIPRANTNLTCMLVGLRVADAMLAARGAQ